MTATLVQTLPEGPEWMYEVKLDGYRALILKSGNHVQIRSRNDKTAQQVITAVQRLGLEGVIAKRRDSRYDAGQRSGAWVKLKLDKQQEFVIGGYRPGNHGVDALIVGYYDGRQLRYAGKVRAGCWRRFDSSNSLPKGIYDTQRFWGCGTIRTQPTCCASNRESFPEQPERRLGCSRWHRVPVARLHAGSVQRR